MKESFKVFPWRTLRGSWQWRSPRAFAVAKIQHYFPGMQGEGDSFLGGNECFLLFLPNLYLRLRPLGNECEE